jgi:hypothetical protein
MHHCVTAVVVQRRVSAAPPPPSDDCDCDTPLLGRCSQEDCDTALLVTVTCVGCNRLRPKAELNARTSSTSMTVRLEEDDTGQVKQEDTAFEQHAADTPRSLALLSLSHCFEDAGERGCSCSPRPSSPPHSSLVTTPPHTSAVHTSHKTRDSTIGKTRCNTRNSNSSEAICSEEELMEQLPALIEPSLHGVTGACACTRRQLLTDADGCMCRQLLTTESMTSPRTSIPVQPCSNEGILHAKLHTEQVLASHMSHTTSSLNQPPTRLHTWILTVA